MTGEDGERAGQMAEQEEIARDVIIVGGGAAGLSAALILARSRRRVTVVDAGAPRNAPAQAVHGLLALDGLSPLELLKRGRDEVTRYGGEIIAAEVRDTSLTSLGFAVRMRDGAVLHARRLLIAAQVGAAAADGARAAAHVNADLVAEDTDRAVARLLNAEAVR